jgi:hypothetical protein
MDGRAGSAITGECLGALSGQVGALSVGVKS